jgi:hypothetical protein
MIRVAAVRTSYLDAADYTTRWGGTKTAPASNSKEDTGFETSGPRPLHPWQNMTSISGDMCFKNTAYLLLKVDFWSPLGH